MRGTPSQASPSGLPPSPERASGDLVGEAGHGGSTGMPAIPARALGPAGGRGGRGRERGSGDKAGMDIGYSPQG